MPPSRKECLEPGCSRRESSYGYCKGHSAAGKRDGIVPTDGAHKRPNLSDARTRADRLVSAWLQADYEPDDVDGAFMSERSIEKLVERLTAVYDGQLTRQPRSEGVGIGLGNPQQVVDGEVNTTSPDCRSYIICLDYVVKKCWKAWTCRACRGPGHPASDAGPSEPQMHNDGTAYDA